MQSRKNQTKKKGMERMEILGVGSCLLTSHNQGKSFECFALLFWGGTHCQVQFSQPATRGFWFSSDAESKQAQSQ